MPLISGGRYFRGDHYFRDLIGGKKLSLLSGSRYFREGRYYRNSTVERVLQLWKGLNLKWYILLRNRQKFNRKLIPL